MKPGTVGVLVCFIALAAACACADDRSLAEPSADDSTGTITAVVPRSDTGVAGQDYAFRIPGEIIFVFPVFVDRPAGLAHDGENLWLAEEETRTLVKYSPQGKLLGSIPAPGEGSPAGLAFDGGHLWVGSVDDQGQSMIYQMSTSGQILSSFAPQGGAGPGSARPAGIAIDGKHVWYVDCGAEPGMIYQCNKRGAVLSSFPCPAGEPRGLGWAPNGYLWHSSAETDTIYELTTTGSIMSSFRSPDARPAGVAIAGSYLWLAAAEGGVIFELDPAVPVPVVLTSFEAQAGEGE